MSNNIPLHAIDIRKKTDRYCNLENNPILFKRQVNRGYLIAEIFENKSRKETEEAVHSLFYTLAAGYIPYPGEGSLPSISLFTRKSLFQALRHGYALKNNAVKKEEMNGWTWTDSGMITITTDIYVKLRQEDNIETRLAIAHTIAHEMSHREFILTGGVTETERVFAHYVSEYWADIAGFRKMGVDKSDAEKISRVEKELLRPGSDGLAQGKTHPSRNSRISFVGKGVFDKSSLCFIADEAARQTGHKLSTEEKKTLVNNTDTEIRAWQHSHPREYIYMELNSVNYT